MKTRLGNSESVCAGGVDVGGDSERGVVGGDSERGTVRGDGFSMGLRPGEELGGCKRNARQPSAFPTLQHPTPRLTGSGRARDFGYTGGLVWFNAPSGQRVHGTG